MGFGGLLSVSASDETKAAYRAAGGVLAQRWCGQEGAKDAAVVCATFQARAKGGMYATSTLRLYREQLLAYIAEIGASPALAASLRNMHLGVLGARQGLTSAKKLQHISFMDAQALLSFLRRDKASQISQQTADLFEASLLFGLRPAEWPSADFDVFEDQWLSDVLVLEPDEIHPTHRLSVVNAKHNLVRANGESRVIYARLTIEQASVVNRCLQASKINARSWKSWYKKLANCLYYAGHALWPRRKRVPCFYTGRHQCIADGKASHSEARALAAIFGHASDWTARKHYSRKVNGDKNRCLLRASRVSLGQVRNQSLTAQNEKRVALEVQATNK